MSFPPMALVRPPPSPAHLVPAFQAVVATARAAAEGERIAVQLLPRRPPRRRRSARRRRRCPSASIAHRRRSYRRPCRHSSRSLPPRPFSPMALASPITTSLRSRPKMRSLPPRPNSLPDPVAVHRVALVRLVDQLGIVAGVPTIVAMALPKRSWPSCPRRAAVHEVRRRSYGSAGCRTAAAGYFTTHGAPRLSARRSGKLWQVGDALPFTCIVNGTQLMFDGELGSSLTTDTGLSPAGDTGFRRQVHPP